LNFQWPQPTTETKRVRAWDALRSIDLSETETLSASGLWGDLLVSVPEGRNYQWFTDREEGPHSLFGYRTRFWSFLLKLAKDKPSWTLPAKPGPSTGPFHWESRPLAVVERQRLQSFPKSWTFEGSLGSQIAQVGNATPPLLAESLGRQLLFSLTGIAPTGRLTLSIPRARKVPAPEPVYPVHPKYLGAAEKPQKAHPGPGLGPKPRQQQTGFAAS